MAAELDYRLADPNLGMEAVEADEGGVVPGGEDVLHHEDVSVKVQASKLPQPGKPMIEFELASWHLVTIILRPDQF